MSQLLNYMAATTAPFSLEQISLHANYCQHADKKLRTVYLIKIELLSSLTSMIFYIAEGTNEQFRHMMAIKLAVWKHRYMTLNRDRKRRHVHCILPVQLISLVGKEAGFALNRFERNKNWGDSFYIVRYCVILLSLKVL